MALQEQDEFERFIRTNPFVLEPRCVRPLDLLREIAGFGPLFASLADLLLEARDSVADAWTNFETRRTHGEEQLADLSATQRQIFGLLQARHFDRALALAESALPTAVKTGLGLTIAVFEDLRAQALFQAPSDDRAEGIEAAIDGFNRALTLAVDPVLRGTVLMHLGLAFGERIKGDRADNLDRAVALLRESVDGLDESSPGEVQSLRFMNLAWALLRRERGDRAADLHEAAELCRTALEHRSLSGEPIDWAHTQINLGDALTQLWELRLVSREEAASAYEVVIESSDLLPEQWIVGAAHFSLGRLERMAAHQSPQELVESYKPGNDNPQELVNWSLLQSAVAHFQQAADLSPVERDAIRRGRILSDLASALMTLGRNSEAIAAATEGLRILTPASDPLGCASVGGTLGGLLAGEGLWDDSASAYRQALAASELSFHSRLDTVAREDEAERAGRLHRWAAYSLAQAGQIEDAVIALENGRTRELRRRLGHSRLDRLHQLPDAYRVAYEVAASRLTASPLGPSSADAGRELQTVLATIRALPGFQDFATGATISDLSDAVEQDWPLLFIDPTPVGTLLLLVARAKENDIRVRCRFLRVTSSELFKQLAVGSAGEEASASPADREPASYLFGIGAAGTAKTGPALEGLLPWLGRVLASPIYEWLEESSLQGATLIACGPISTAPLHAAHWEFDGNRHRLIDRFELRHAPSAVVASAAIRRAAERASEDPYLVGLANPTEDLPAAVPEITEIAAHFVDRSAYAVGKDATWPFLRRKSKLATHLHLSCHARGGLFADSDALLLLADGPVTLGQLTRLQLTTRLATVSACQTALASIARLQDESLSIGTSLLAVGSACAIASLWPVDDTATAVLMIRVYEEMIRNALSPPVALRRAALWLETATWDELTDFLVPYPLVRDEFARRSDVDETMTWRTGSVAGGSAPFAHPVYWAAFIASGA